MQKICKTNANRCNENANGRKFKLRDHMMVLPRAHFVEMYQKFGKGLKPHFTRAKRRRAKKHDFGGHS